MGEATCQTGHVVALVRSVPGVINFILNWELPIPISRLFPQHDYILKFLHYCPCPLDVYNKQHKYACGAERFALHCHCYKPHSLECQAAAVIMYNVVKKFIAGAGYCNKFLLYRELCNKDCSNCFAFVGSCWVQKRHYIYVKCNLGGMYIIARKHVYLGNHMSCSGSYGNYIILVCDKCKDLSEYAAYACARRTRRVMLKCFKAIKINSPWKLISSKKNEQYRQQCIRRFVRYKLPINIDHRDWVSF